ncbi:unnamed protein product [Brassica oleracea var. botrytis]
MYTSNTLEKCYLEHVINREISKSCYRISCEVQRRGRSMYLFGRAGFLTMANRACKTPKARTTSLRTAS